MGDDVISRACSCPERDIDLACYGTHFCKDGKRIAPEDIYVEPLNEDINAERHAALKRERANLLDRLSPNLEGEKDKSNGRA